jgi:hypothetical protein
LYTGFSITVAVTILSEFAFSSLGVYGGMISMAVQVMHVGRVRMSMLNRLMRRESRLANTIAMNALTRTAQICANEILMSSIDVISSHHK